jgi:hypothetical protein
MLSKCGGEALRENGKCKGVYVIADSHRITRVSNQVNYAGR